MKNKILKLGKETMIYGVSTVLARLLNFCLVPFYTYVLMPGEYGVIATVFSVIAFFYVLYLFGMDQALLRFASKGENKKEVFLHAFYGVVCVSVILSVLLCLFSTGFAHTLGLGTGSGKLIRLAAAVLFLDALNMLPFTKLRLERKAWYFASVRTFSITVNVACNIIFLAVLKTGIEGVMWANIAASAASLICLLPVLFKELFPNPVITINKKLRNEMLKFSWPFVPSGLASIMVNVIDKPLLVYLAGLSFVGVYQANFKIGVFMMLVVSMFDQAWRPFFLEHAKEKNAKELFAKIFTVFCAVGLWAVLGISFLMPEIIRTQIAGFYFIHPDYWGGMGIIPLVVTAYFFYGLYVNFMVAPVLTEKTGILLVSTLTGAAVSILTNIILVPKIGLAGAGTAILLSYVSMAVILFIFLQRNYPIKYEYGKLGVLVLAALILAGLNALLPADLGGVRVTIKIIFLILFPLLAYKVAGLKKLPM